MLSGMVNEWENFEEVGSLYYHIWIQNMLTFDYFFNFFYRVSSALNWKEMVIFTLISLPSRTSITWWCLIRPWKCGLTLSNGLENVLRRWIRMLLKEDWVCHSPKQTLFQLLMTFALTAGNPQRLTRISLTLMLSSPWEW